MDAPLHDYIRPIFYFDFHHVLVAAIHQHIVLIEQCQKATFFSPWPSEPKTRQEKQSTAMKHTTQDGLEDFPQYYVKMLFGAVYFLQGKHVSGSLHDKMA